MTSKGKHNIVKGFCHQWQKYYQDFSEVIVCGFEDDSHRHMAAINDFSFNKAYYTIGKFADYPVRKWSDALIKILDEVAEDVFILMLDDYWLYRPTDTRAIGMIRDYMHQFQNVLKFDLGYERLYSDTPPNGQNRFYWGHNTYDTLGYLDLIQSNPNGQYHMSLWGGMWRRDLLKQVLIPNERAQEIEMHGGNRLLNHPEWLVLGTRQGPMVHANVIQNNGWNRQESSGLPRLTATDYDELEKLGCIV